MNWNPFKRIADLERQVASNSSRQNEMLHMVASASARVRKLEQKMGRESVLADFEDHTVQTSGGLPTGLLTWEQTQALIDKRVRQNAAARKYYAKRKAKEAQS
jgi:hypothetical protein